MSTAPRGAVGSDGGVRPSSPFRRSGGVSRRQPSVAVAGVGEDQVLILTPIQ
jgi:hypothetical protein